MKVVCSREDLARGISTVGRAAIRNGMPILANILLAASKAEGLKLSATNLRFGITCWINAKVEQEGVTTVPAHTFADLINTLSSDLVDMEQDRAALRVECGFRSSLRTVDADEFPLIPSVDKWDFQVAPKTLCQMFRQVTFAALQDRRFPNSSMTGVLIRLHKTPQSAELILAATDGIRLSEQRVQPEEATVSMSAIVPAYALDELRRIINNANWKGPVKVALTPTNQIVFHMIGVEFVSQLINGEFPNYQSLLARATPETRVTVKVADLARAYKIINTIARDNSGHACLTVKPDESIIVDAATGTSSAQGIVDGVVEGSPAKVALSTRLMLDLLSAVDAQDITIEINGAGPVVIRTSESEFVHVIAPMNLE